MNAKKLLLAHWVDYNSLILKILIKGEKGHKITKKKKVDFFLPFRHLVHLLELAVTFIESLENHLEAIRNIPHLDENLKKMVSINSST